MFCRLGERSTVFDLWTQVGTVKGEGVGVTGYDKWGFIEFGRVNGADVKD